jgi:hypothetical protein
MTFCQNSQFIGKNLKRENKEKQNQKLGYNKMVPNYILSFEKCTRIYSTGRLPLHGFSIFSLKCFT